MKKAWFSRERKTRTNIRVSYMHVLHIRPIPLIAARIPIQIVPSRSTNWWRRILSRSWCILLPLGFVFPWKYFPSDYNHHLISRVNWPVATNPLPVYYNMIFPLLTGLYQMYRGFKVFYNRRYFLNFRRHLRAVRGPGGRKLLKSSILWTKKCTSETAKH